MPSCFLHFFFLNWGNIRVIPLLPHPPPLLDWLLPPEREPCPSDSTRWCPTCGRWATRPRILSATYSECARPTLWLSSSSWSSSRSCPHTVNSLNYPHFCCKIFRYIDLIVCFLSSGNWTDPSFACPGHYVVGTALRLVLGRAWTGILVLYR